MYCKSRKTAYLHIIIVCCIGFADFALRTLCATFGMIILL